MDHFGELNWKALGGLIATESQYLSHQIACTASGFVNFLKARQGGGVLCHILFGQVNIAQYRTQNIVEVVGNSACHCAHGLHLLGFPKLRFQGDPLHLRELFCSQVTRENSGHCALNAGPPAPGSI